MIVIESEKSLSQDAKRAIESEFMACQMERRPVVLGDGIKIRTIGPYVVVNKSELHQTYTNHLPMKVYGPYLSRDDARNCVREKSADMGGEWCIVECEYE